MLKAVSAARLTLRNPPAVNDPARARLARLGAQCGAPTLFPTATRVGVVLDRDKPCCLIVKMYMINALKA
jgi:hypothetical protein